MVPFLFLCILARRVISQGTVTAGGPISTVPSSGGSNTGIQDCSACYGVAPIDQIIIGDGGSFSVGLGSFTWNLAEVFSAQTDGPSLVALPTASVITYQGIPIGDPTMYNVFTSFLVVALHEPNGTCVSTTLAQTGLAELTPLSIVIPSGTTSAIIPQAESSIIQYFNSVFGGLSCVTTSGGVAITTTVTTSTTSLFRPSSLPESIASPSAVTQTLSIPVASSSAPSQSNGTTSDSFATPTSNNSSITPAASSNDPGLSQSAKIGIGVGVGVGGAIILAIAGMISWKRSTIKTHLARKSHPSAELSSKRPYSQVELESNGLRQELENNVPPQELSGEQRLELD